MKTKRIIAKEGDVIAIPLNQGGYGIGLVARTNKRTMLGYFFNNVYQTVPTDILPGEINEKNVVLVAKFSSLGIEDGTWPILARFSNFTKTGWPIPVFKMQHALTGKYFAIIYEEDLLNEKSRHLVTGQEASLLFEHGSHGYISLENALSKLLRV